MVEKIESAIEIQGGGLNGLKMILGAALIALAHQVDMINDLIGINPAWDATLQLALGWIKEAVEIVEWLIKISGNGLLSLGALHKVWKYIKG